MHQTIHDILSCGILLIVYLARMHIFFKKLHNLFTVQNILLLLPSLTVLFWLPNQLYPFAGVKSYFFSGVLLLLIVSLCIAKIVKHQKISVSLDRIDIFLLVFLIGMIFTSVTGVDTKLSFFSTLDRGVGVLLWVFAVLYFLIIKNIFKKNSRSIYFLDYGLVISGVVVSVLIWCATYKIIPQMFLSGLQGNSSLAGAVILLCIPSFFILINKYYSEKKKSQLFVMLTAFLIMSISPLFISGFSLGESRGVVLALFLSLIPTVGFYFLVSKRSLFSNSGKIILGFFIVLSIVCTAMIFKSGSAPQTFFKEHSGSNRLVFWDTAFQSIHDRPFLGYGNETFEYSFFKHFDPVVYRAHEGWADKPHNAFIEIIHDNGIIVFSLYLLLLGYCYFTLYKNGKDREYRTESLIYFFVLSAYLFQNALVFDSPVSIVLFCVLLARISYRSMSEVSFNIPTLYSYIAIVASVVAAYFFVFCPISEGNKMYLLMSIPVQRVGEFANPVFQTSNVGGVVTSAYISNRIMNQIESMPEKKSEYSQSLNALASAVVNEKNSSHSFPAQLFLARANTYIYEESGTILYLKKAQEYAKNAVVLSKLNPEGYWIYAYSYALDGNSKEALLAARTVVEIDPNLREAYSRLIFLARKLGNKAVEKGTIEDAKKHFPDFDKTY